MKAGVAFIIFGFILMGVATPKGYMHNINLGAALAFIYGGLYMGRSR